MIIKLKNKKESRFNEEDFNFMAQLMTKSYIPPSYFNNKRNKRFAVKQKEV